MKIELSTEDISYAVKNWILEKHKLIVDGPVHFYINPFDQNTNSLTAQVEISEEK